MANVTTSLWKSYGGKGFAAEYSSYANRAGKDINGNSLELTIEDGHIQEIGGRLVSEPISSDNISWQVFDDAAPPTPPVPTIEYFILENFADGGSISPIIPSLSCEWITTVPTEDEMYENWWDTDGVDHFVDSTPGATLLDSRNPVDFSSYGIQNGTPYGMITSNNDETLCSVVYDAENHLPGPFTLEFWTFSRVDYTYGSGWLCRLGMPYSSEGSEWHDYINLALCLNTAASVLYLGFAFGNNVYDTEGEGVVFLLDEATLGEKLGLGEPVDISSFMMEWHHYAICIDTNKLYLFIDGHKMGEKALADSISVVGYDDYFNPYTVTKTVGEFLAEVSQHIYIKGYNGNQWSYDGGYAQIAACGECKWTENFTPPTIAYTIQE